MFLELPHFGASLPQSGLQLPDSCAMQFGPQLPDSCAIQFGSPLQEIISMRSDSYVQALNTSFEGLSALLECWKESFDDDTQLEPSIAVSEDTMQAIRELEPLVPEDQREEFQKIVASTTENQEDSTQEFLPHLKATSKKHLTFSDTIALINVLVAIFFGIIQSMPSKQQERIIEQGDIQIAQNDTIIQNQEKILEQQVDTALPDALNVSNGSIHLLMDETEILCDELKSSDEVVDSDRQFNAEDGLQKNTDVQD